VKSIKNKTEEMNPDLVSGKVLPLMEDFYTIQGEGYHQGRAAYFIRLGGCDVGCHWCDVKDSWDASRYQLIDVEVIARKASKFQSKIIVVTGGEPLTYNLSPLCESLHKSGLKTHIETSGVYPLTGDWDWICFSPKKFKEPLPDIFSKANELKIIIYNKSDFNWAESFVPKMNSGCKLYLQPEWSVRKEMMPVMVDYVKNNPRWEISLQIHKFLDIP
jgi:7-carboxy-7-deazaguanine synthase